MKRKQIGNFTLIMSLALIVVIAVMSFALGTFFTVDEGYRGIVLRNGRAVNVADPGLHFKAPFIDSVVDVSVQTMRADMDHVTAYSKDVQQSTSAVAINFNLSPSSVLEVYSELGLDYANKVLEPSVMRRFKEAFGLYTAAEIVRKRDELATKITDLVRADMKAYGIAVETVQIRNIDFSDTYEQAIETAAKAEADVKKETQLLEQVKVSSQRQVAEAEAAAKARKLAADAEAYQIETRGRANALAIELRGKALRDNPQLVTLVAAEKWDGKLPSTQVPGSAVPFISIPRGE